MSDRSERRVAIKKAEGLLCKILSDMLGKRVNVYIEPTGNWVQIEYNGKIYERSIDESFYGC